MTSPWWKLNEISNLKALTGVPAHLQLQIHLQQKFLQYPPQQSRNLSCQVQLGLAATGYSVNDLYHKISLLPLAQIPHQCQLFWVKCRTFGLLYCWQRQLSPYWSAQWYLGCWTLWNIRDNQPVKQTFRELKTQHKNFSLVHNSSSRQPTRNKKENLHTIKQQEMP